MDKGDPFGSGRPPSWWSEGEGWRGSSGPGRHWGSVRWFRRFVVGVLVLFVLLPVLFTVALTAAFAGWTGAAVAAISSVAILATGVLLGRFLFRGLRTVRELVEATAGLADGDYSTRVSEPVPPAFGPMVGSFNQMAERLEHADELRRRLLADVGHELRTPLTIIRGELEAMADGVRELNETEIRRLLVDVGGMERLLDDLKTLSTTEAGVLELEREPTDLGALVTTVVDRFQSEAEAKLVTIALDPTGDQDLEIAVDPFRITEVVSNLIANALRATGTGGKVTVVVRDEHSTTSGSESQVAIDVTDDGVGIPSDQLDAVFDRFNKGPDSNGSGLGLTISRGLIEAHGGSIDVSSASGQGTTMTVRLPRSAD